MTSDIYKKNWAEDDNTRNFTVSRSVSDTERTESRVRMAARGNTDGGPEFQGGRAGQKAHMLT